MSKLIIKKFKPPYLCVGGEHYALNPYSGCFFNCKYCYSNPNKSLIINDDLTFFKEQLKQLPNNVIEIGTYTDAYQPIESKKGIMRSVLNLLISFPHPIVINTKGTLIMRDIDLLKELSNKTYVSIGISINKLNDNILDTNAPSPIDRINLLKKLLDHGLNAYLRYDPIIPFYNSDEVYFKEIINKFKETNLERITISTFKPISYKQLKSIDELLNLNSKLVNLYKKGKWIKGSLFLPYDIRFKIINNLIKQAGNLKVSTCREGFYIGLCDNINYKLFKNY